MLEVMPTGGPSVPKRDRLDDPVDPNGGKWNYPDMDPAGKASKDMGTRETSTRRAKMHYVLNNSSKMGSLLQHPEEADSGARSRSLTPPPRSNGSRARIANGSPSPSKPGNSTLRSPAAAGRSPAIRKAPPGQDADPASPKGKRIAVSTKGGSPSQTRNGSSKAQRADKRGHSSAAVAATRPRSAHGTVAKLSRSSASKHRSQSTTTHSHRTPPCNDFYSSSKGVAGVLSHALA